MDTTVLEVRTGDRFAIVDLTDQVRQWVRGRGSGLCNLFAAHATAGLGLMETGAGSEEDARRALDRLLPRDDTHYRHRHGTPGHGADHVLPLFVSPSLTIPVSDGRLVLGRWQSIVLIDPNVDNPSRRVHLSFLGTPP